MPTLRSKKGTDDEGIDDFDLTNVWSDGTIGLTRDGKRSEILLMPSLDGQATFMQLGNAGRLRGEAFSLYQRKLKEKRNG